MRYVFLSAPVKLCSVARQPNETLQLALYGNIMLAIVVSAKLSYSTIYFFAIFVLTQYLNLTNNLSFDLNLN